MSLSSMSNEVCDDMFNMDIVKVVVILNICSKCCLSVAQKKRLQGKEFAVFMQDLTILPFGPD